MNESSVQNKLQLDCHNKHCMTICVKLKKKATITTVPMGQKFLLSIFFSSKIKTWCDSKVDKTFYVCVWTLLPLNHNLTATKGSNNNIITPCSAGERTSLLIKEKCRICNLVTMVINILNSNNEITEMSQYSHHVNFFNFTSFLCCVFSLFFFLEMTIK